MFKSANGFRVLHFYRGVWGKMKENVLAALILAAALRSIYVCGRGCVRVQATGSSL